MTRVKLHFIAMAGALLARGTGLVYARPTVRAAQPGPSWRTQGDLLGGGGEGGPPPQWQAVWCHPAAR